jgi:hypothetical protein
VRCAGVFLACHCHGRLRGCGLFLCRCQCRWHAFDAPDAEQVQAATHYMGGVMLVPPPPAEAKRMQPAALMHQQLPRASPASAPPPPNTAQHAHLGHSPIGEDALVTSHMAAAAEAAARAAMQMAGLRLQDQQQLPAGWPFAQSSHVQYAPSAVGVSRGLAAPRPAYQPPLGPATQQQLQGSLSPGMDALQGRCALQTAMQHR